MCQCHVSLIYYNPILPSNLVSESETQFDQFCLLMCVFVKRITYVNPDVNKFSNETFQIMGYIVEGRKSDSRGRRRSGGSSGPEYKKLSTNVEEEMPNLDRGASQKDYIY